MTLLHVLPRGLRGGCHPETKKKLLHDGVDPGFRRGRAVAGILLAEYVVLLGRRVAVDPCCERESRVVVKSEVGRVSDGNQAAGGCIGVRQAPVEMPAVV